ncbi:sugar ABC transporter substrate-binding protein, partial [Paenibacillus sepulcri]|nr:sugar ABC transporter substrate-binding protein [Paenibacillus sepulcri]
PDLIAKWAEVKPGHQDGFKDAVMRQTLENGENSFDYYLKNSDKINAILTPALDQVWLGKKSVEQAFKEVSAKANAEFKGTYPKG